MLHQSIFLEVEGWNVLALAQSGVFYVLMFRLFKHCYYLCITNSVGDSISDLTVGSMPAVSF
jgi:hypothetical protein